MAVCLCVRVYDNIVLTKQQTRNHCPRFAYSACDGNSAGSRAFGACVAYWGNAHMLESERDVLVPLRIHFSIFHDKFNGFMFSFHAC